MSGLMYSILSYHVIIMLILPVVVSCLYCERTYVIYTTVLSVPVMVASHLIAFMLKIVPDEPLVTLEGVLLYGIIPRVILSQAGHQFDPQITKLFDEHFDEFLKVMENYPDAP